MVNTAVIFMLCSLTSLSLGRGNEGEAAIRNLYNAITERINDFENNCEPPAARGGNKPAFIRLKQPKEKPVEKEKSRLVLYPNPATNYVSINYLNIKQITIIDVMGRIVKNVVSSGKANTENINISGLHKGIYLVKVISIENIFETKKLIVQ